MLVVVTLLAVLALALVVLYVVREQARRSDQADDEVSHGTPSLEYAVPTGQDPTVVLAALESAGYTATVDPGGAHQVVRVPCPGGVEAERERVRAVIESADVTTPEDGVPLHAAARFRDE